MSSCCVLYTRDWCVHIQWKHWVQSCSVHTRTCFTIVLKIYLILCYILLQVLQKVRKDSHTLISCCTMQTHLTYRHLTRRNILHLPQCYFHCTNLYFPLLCLVLNFTCCRFTTRGGFTFICSRELVLCKLLLILTNCLQRFSTNTVCYNVLCYLVRRSVVLLHFSYSIR